MAFSVFAFQKIYRGLLCLLLKFGEPLSRLAERLNLSRPRLLVFISFRVVRAWIRRVAVNHTEKVGFPFAHKSGFSLTNEATLLCVVNPRT